MANINKIKAQGNVYDIEDTVARSSAVAVSSKTDGTVELKMPNLTVTLPSLTNFGDPSELEHDVVTEISDLKSQIAQNSGVPTAVKNALDTLLQNVAFKNTDVYTDELAVVHNWATAVNLISISAVYNQSETVYDYDSLDSLKNDLVVTALYDNGSSNVVSDYTLSGNLTVGTSTITVAYSGKTTSFNVTVTTDKPSQYTWLYDYRDGLLSEQSYIASATPTGTASETISNDALNLYTEKGQSMFVYGFTDSTSTDAILTAKMKLNGWGYLTSSTSGTGGLRLQLSNGSRGAQAYFIDLDTVGNHKLMYLEGSTKKYVDLSNYDFSEYHIVEVKLQNGVQKISIDGTELVNSSTLSSSYCTAHRLINQAGGLNGQNTDTDIKWLAYYEVS